jgi:transcriptional regulator with XRE-family HTH domain
MVSSELKMRNTHFIPQNENAQGALRDPHLLPTIGRMKVGKRIRQIRKAAGMTLADVEARAGLSDGNLSRIERGEQWISEEKLYSLAEALSVQAADFFTNDEPTRLRRVRNLPGTVLGMSAETPQELRILAAYRMANAEGRAVIDDAVDVAQEMFSGDRAANQA